MKNRIASLFLVFAMLMSLCVSAGARDNRITVQSGGAERFTDVPTSHWAYGYINKVVGSGLFNGRTPTTFEPSSAMTRSQFVMVMARMEGYGSLEGVETVTQFPDVTPTRRAAGPIKWAADEGIVQGFGDGTFKPDSPITRGQFAALIHRYIVAKRYVNLNVLDPQPAQFTDAASVSTAFTADVEYARVHGLLTGYSDGTVRASNPITRAAIAAILARFLDLVTESGYTPFLDGPSGQSVTSGDTPAPVDVPTSYDGITIKVSGDTHGAKPTVSATRNGVTVAADDLKEGDRVTITYKPDDGYTATVRVRDANKRSVSVNRIDANSSWFYMPKAIPATVTVTYSKESSGGGGGGGGGGSSSGGSGYVPPTYYYLNATANVTNAGGVVYLSDTLPTVTTNLDGLTATATKSFLSVSPNVTGYVWVVLDDGRDVDTVTVTTSGSTQAQHTAPTPATDANGGAVTVNGKKVVYFSITGTGLTTNPDTVTITITLKNAADQSKINWTVSAQGDGAYFRLSNAATVPTEAVTAETALPTLNWTDVGAQSASVYLAVSPQPGYKFGNGLPEIYNDSNATITLVSPASPAESDALRVYRITKSGLTTGTTTTTVVVSMAPTQGVEHTWSVGVVTKLYENNAVRDLRDTDTEVPRASAESPATMGNTVTIKVPQTTGYGVGYRVYGTVKVTGASGKVVNVKAPADLSASLLEYTFTMPDEPVTAEVVYELIPDNSLSYSVKVTFNGKGNLALNIAGQSYSLPDSQYQTSADVYTIPVKVKGADGALRDMTQSEYVKAYPNRTDWALPVYVSGTPVAADGFKYDNKLTGAEVYVPVLNPTTNEYPPVPNSYYKLNAGAELAISVTFDPVKLFGYNLTIIGKGTVSGSFNGTPFTWTNNDEIPQTFTSGSVVADFGQVVVTAPTGFDASTFVADALRVSGNASPANANYGDTITISEGMVDLVVNIHERERTAVPFTVTVGANGSVEVKSENGSLLPGSQASGVAEAKTKLDNNTGVLTSNPVLTSNSGTQTYYAYSGSIITLVPTPNTNYKTYSVKVTKGNEALSDVLSAAGFSFKLTDSSAADVKFGQLNAANAYSVLAQAPYSGAVSATSVDLHTQSTTIATTSTIKSILYSLNNGQLMGTTTDKNYITNGLHSTPGYINRTLEYYLNTARNKDGELGKDVLQRMVVENVQSNISNNLSAIIEAQKESLISGETRANLNAQLSTSLKSVNAAQNNVAVTGEAKSSLIKTILSNDTSGLGLQGMFDRNEITENDFTITVNVKPILSADDEQSTEAAGKSVQKQLETFIMDYLRNLKLREPYNVPTANVTVTVPSRIPAEITVAASANFGANQNLWPQLDNSVKFASYLDQLNVWATVELSSATLTTGGNTVTLPVPATSNLYSITKFGSAGDTVKNAISGRLADVDNSISSTWMSTLQSMMGASGMMQVDMGKVLTQNMLDQIVDSLLTDAINTLVSKMESINRNGDAPATRAAFMNLYRDFVVFDGSAPERLLSLKTKGAEDSYVVVGKAQDKNLVLTLDFEQILRDGGYASGATKNPDETPYEKLVDLLVAFRDGIATDIRLKSEELSRTAGGQNKQAQTAQSVFADLIESQIKNRRGSLTGVKWGTQLTNLSSESRKTERKELANLLAELIMTPLDDSQTMQKAWQNFEDKGYQSVQFSINLDGRTRGSVSPAIESLNGTLGRTDTLGKALQNINVGLNVKQEIQAP